MEDDNTVDVLKWLFKDETRVDCKGVLTVKNSETPLKWNARLKGNLLGLSPVEAVAEEPMLLVCECIRVERVADEPLTFSIHHGDHDLRFEAESEDDLYQWMVNLSIASHQQKQAEMDQALHEFNVASISTPTEDKSPTDNSLYNFFLASPVRAEHTFSVFHSYNVPHRKISCEEVMYESKLSMVIPFELVRMFRKRCSDLRDNVHDALSNVRNAVMFEATHHVMRHLNSNIEVYTQMIEFMDDYTGPLFRPSKEKFRLAFSAVPINLHVQCFHISGEPSWHAVTCGAVSATPLRYKNGGLTKMRESLKINLDENGQSHTEETRFYLRRKSLMNAKNLIADLTRRISNDWKIEKFGVVDKLGLQLVSEVKQLHGALTDLIKSFPNINNLVDALCEGGPAQMLNPTVKETLANQLDALDAAIISLNTKIAVIDTVDDQSSRESFENNAKSSLNSVLDSLHHLVDTLLMAQLLGLVVALRKPSNAEAFFQIQLRSDIVLSQAITVVTTCLLTNIERSTKEELTSWTSHGPFISFFGFLSAYRDEKGMIEDMKDIWSIFYGHVRFAFTPLNSSIAKSCIPHIAGTPTAVDVTIPLTAEAFAKLPEALANGEWFRVRTVYWNIGINHEATFAASLGDTSLEDSINLAALTMTSAFIKSAPVSCGELVTNLLADLKKTVEECPSRKNTAIFPKVQALTRALNGVNVLSCKSGKDRTSMAVTLEEGNALRQNFGIAQRQAEEIIDCLRRDGVRLENCRKNIGKAVYSFSPFQMHFLPKEFRPPSGTFTQNVAS